MYNEFDKYLLGYFTDDYWYDEGFSIAREMLSEFSDDDWLKLQDELMEKDIDWQKKLAYCIDNTSKMYELETLLTLSTVKDNELFNICIDSLRSFIIDDNYKKIVSQNELLVRQVDDLISAPNKGIIKGIYQDFIDTLRE
ncbi:hypothetical protein [Lacrimispora indolis]|uniref:hypothetical protein n=1 Tax=Lacrimispora indolis TaxID=69825 RepID=UPI0004626646|nr:hypothetical protein [[Clostridium] methoxybenzovorans]